MPFLPAQSELQIKSNSMKNSHRVQRLLLILLFPVAFPAHAEIVPGEPPLGKEVTTIVVLPDTQNYSQFHPSIHEAQVRWILREKGRRNIAAVLHLGDSTNTNSRSEWTAAKRAMDPLEGKIPYVMATGNHDYGPAGHATSRDSPFNEFFPIDKMARAPTFGGSYDKEPGRSDNTYHLIDAARRKWLVLSLEFGPRIDVIRWANEVVSKYPDRSAILITHAYLYSDGTRYDWKRKGTEQSWNPHIYGVAKLEGGVNDGEELWNRLVSRHSNFVLTINGHVLNSGLGYLMTPGRDGQPVHQMLVNFQEKSNGGDGWLRILEIQEDGKTLRVYDYSPTLESRNTSPENQFEIVLAPARLGPAGLK